MPDPLGGFAYTWPFLAGALLAYLVGSIPIGLVLTRIAGLGDIRDIGSGNIGATNVLRTGNKTLAALTLLLDVAKGAVPVLVGARFGPDMAVVAAGAVVIGHMFPLWLRFRGGKGVATGVGAVFVLSWPVGLICMATWLVLVAATRYVSLGSTAAAIAAPVAAYWLADPQRTEVMILIAALIVIRHQANIRRLLRGEESRISLGGKDG